ncbi:MAG: carboxypeptidase regulatory-like domain-containing protein [Myxococcales bacterium]|nr:MAG: carboxypeptidase regulatory-like domain-containing protein [Myxococcales bacterium]
MRSQKNGSFALPRLAEGEYDIRISAPGYVTEHRMLDMKVRRHAPSEIDLGDITLKSAGSVSGQVSDRYGRPVPGALIAYLDGAVAKTTDVHSDSSGVFSVQGLRPGRYLFYATHPVLGDGQSRRPHRIFEGENTPDILIRFDKAMPVTENNSR